MPALEGVLMGKEPQPRFGPHEPVEHLAGVSERDWQRQIVETAEWGDWWWYHVPDSRRSNAGFPDLVLLHAERGAIFVEVKTEKGRVSPAQRMILGVMDAAGLEVRVWRPSDGDEVMLRLLGARWKGTP